MKHFFRLFLGIIILFFFQTHAFCAENVRIGVIDIQKLQQNSSSFQKIKKALEKKFQVLQRKLEKERAEIKKLEESLKKQSMMLSLDARMEKRRELEKKIRYFKYLQNESAQEAKYMEMEARRKVIKAVEKVVDRIAKKKRYTMIVEKRTVGLVYYNNTIDITDEIIKAYDKLKK